jgi:hypothetical protein
MAKMNIEIINNIWCLFSSNKVNTLLAFKAINKGARLNS